MKFNYVSRGHTFKSCWDPELQLPLLVKLSPLNAFYGVTLNEILTLLSKFEHELTSWAFVGFLQNFEI